MSAQSFHNQVCDALDEAYSRAERWMDCANPLRIAERLQFFGVDFERYDPTDLLPHVEGWLEARRERR